MGFAYYKKCTIQTGQVPSSQSSFPALMPFLSGDADFKTTANGGKATSSSGFDIRPFSDQYLNNPLTFELVTSSYSATAGSFEMWVNITAVDGAVVYMAVGDPTVTTDGSSTSTWNANFIAVYHFGTSTTLALTDSTSNGNTLTNNNTATAGTGQIGGAVSLASASTQFLSLASIAPTSAMTISAWTNMTSLPAASAYYGVVCIDNEQSMFIQSGGHTAMYFTTTVPATVGYDPGTGTAMTASTWHYISMTYDSTNGAIGKLDAATDGTGAANGTLEVTATDMSIGRDPGTAGRAFNGLIDEVHLYSTNVSANWVTTEYHNQNAPNTFWGKGTITPNMFGAITV